mmetsp:Transcript_6672/g.13949  ORF Transcript_6672/g.13949 Transcript_6672/m.13949 type:complete len:121 (-) Transcript_6672:338-700(-)|eukprot:CAMPEP_0172442432 /NCGR_PEP_ID=MMETSP1065-20121228/2853_1 /TAXON_ID=265537 /ORGANISM="Amphiprora paludosa, Strain CCMP125" /LENGTH=120 /DNA_ID=CAMNT_0013192275 /DNA_START=216 /DNA_END=578 /DNA_ORIENTATION=-
MTAASDVINWEEAMQQCGDDEEFLRELLVDLRTEVETQVTNINGIVQSPPAGVNPYEQIMRSAHMLKGASANLMCSQLRMSSLKLEEAARNSNQIAVQTAYGELQVAIQNFFAYLQSIGL